MSEMNDTQITAFLVHQGHAIEAPHEWAKYLTVLTGYVFAYQGEMDRGGADAYHVFYCNAPTVLKLRSQFQSVLSNHEADEVLATIDAGPVALSGYEDFPEYEMLTAGVLFCETCEELTHHHLEREETDGANDLTFNVTCSCCGDMQVEDLIVPLKDREDYYKVVPRAEVEAYRELHGPQESDFEIFMEGPAKLHKLMSQMCEHEFPTQKCTIAVVSDDSVFTTPEGDDIRFGDGHIRLRKVDKNGSTQTLMVTAQEVTIH